MGFNNKKNFSYDLSGGVSRSNTKGFFDDPDVKEMRKKLRALNIGKTKKKKNDSRRA